MTMTDAGLRIPEVARRLRLDGPAVYDLILDGRLPAGKGPDGVVYVRESAVAEYERGHTTSAP